MLELENIVRDFKLLQDNICRGLEELDGKARFIEDKWKRPEGGGGRSRIIQDGSLIEKGGVNFSHVHGALPENIAQKLKLPSKIHFHATGVSIVLHAAHPLVPIIHMNVRYFQIDNGLFWFGGGVDLTPIYVDPKLAVSFHQKLKKVCDAFHPDYYKRFKAWCDDYFYIRHRKETRGIGGIFFDHLNETEMPKQDLFNFVKAVGNEFVPLYREQAEAKRHKPFSEAEKEFQALRRSRYVEFNLVYDKGTKFGLDTDGRTESILMSMPPSANWQYNYQPTPGSAEALTLQALQPTNWLALEKERLA